MYFLFFHSLEQSSIEMTFFLDLLICTNIIVEDINHICFGKQINGYRNNLLSTGVANLNCISRLTFFFKIVLNYLIAILKKDTILV